MTNVQKWRRATALFSVTKKQAPTPTSPPTLEQVRLAITDLERFMKTNGDDAIALLQASGRRVYFATERDDCGTAIAFWTLSGSGLTVTHHQDDSPASADDIIQAATDPKKGNKRPSEVIISLWSELNEIAASAPEFAKSAVA